jgi:rhamnulokinase
VSGSNASTSAGFVAAVDLGATSGRVMLGRIGPNALELRQVARFPNGPIQHDDGLHWDVTGLYANITAGLTAALRDEPGIRSIGVDSWAVDYGLLREGQLLGEPFHYRDERNLAGVEAVHGIVPFEELYRINGLQFLPFNTLYQLTVDRVGGRLTGGETPLLIPDLINYWLTGGLHTERTNASTTGLLNVTTGEWDAALPARLGLPEPLFPALVDAGTTIGGLTRTVAETLGADSGVTVTTVGSHDTASAVVGVPARTDDFAYISCGTWGLVGVELERPVLSDASRLANFTNEGGVDGRTRYLHNVMGLWLLSESVRTWEAAGTTIELPALLAEAGRITTAVPVFDANDPRFLTPGDLPQRIADWCGEHGVAAPQTPAEFVRSILESLADAFARAVDTAAELSGKTVSVIHMVGGGSQNALLCQLTANRSGREVVAGPVEATAIGNVLIQGRAQRLLSGSLESLRDLVARSFEQAHYLPR